MPRQSKHCHMLAQGTSQHITVLCCVSAAGATVPPLMVFTKRLPSVRAMKDDGPINGTFSSTDSILVDGDANFEWFVKNFLRFALGTRTPIAVTAGWCICSHQDPANRQSNQRECYSPYVITIWNIITTRTPVAVTTGWCICSHHDPANRQGNRRECYSPYVITIWNIITTRTPVAVTTGWCICSHHDPANRQGNRGECYSPMFSS